VPLAAWDEIDDPAAVPVPGWDRDDAPPPAAPKPLPGSPVLGAAIRQARHAAGLSQRSLAVVLAVTQQAVQSWEVAEATPGDRNWEQLELTLGPLGIARPQPVQAREAATETSDAA
jgi:hypothetical protein